MRNNIPVLKPAAGLFPICITVLEQMEHCASLVVGANATIKKMNKARNIFRMIDLEFI